MVSTRSTSPHAREKRIKENCGFVGERIKEREQISRIVSNYESWKEGGGKENKVARGKEFDGRFNGAVFLSLSLTDFPTLENSKVQP